MVIVHRQGSFRRPPWALLRAGGVYPFIGGAVRVDKGHRRDPGLPGQDPEEGYEGPVEGAEVVRIRIAEEGDPDDGV
jgi:hypothetical protein